MTPTQRIVTPITPACKTAHRPRAPLQAKLNLRMLDRPVNDFAILTNRRRAIIALVHSIVFLGIAAAGFASHKNGILHGNAPQGDFILVMIYLTVTSILSWLAGVSRRALERVYFALCACSATFGLLRTSFGDSALPIAQYMRVVMLTSAVLLGSWIVRSYSRPAAETAVSD